MSNNNEKKKLDKRGLVVKEIIETELKYVEELRILVECFMCPIRTYLNELLVQHEENPDDSEESIQVYLNEHNTIFSNVEQLCAFNEVFLKDIKSSFDVNRGNNIGHVFAHASAFFKMYSTYTSNYSNAEKTVKKWLTTSPRLGAFIRAVELQKKTHGLQLASYLIMPVQRIPRYKMLLNELVKLTPVTHRDYHKLTEAVSTISHVATSLNDDMKQLEQRRETVAICEQFEDMTIMSPSRLFLKEGDLMKVCQHGKKIFKFVLFNDFLMYGQDDILHKKTSTGKRKHKIHRKFYLCELFIVRDVPNLPDGFMLVSHQKSFYVDCGSVAEKMVWIKELESAFEGLRNKMVTESMRLSPGSTSSVQRVQVWGLGEDGKGGDGTKEEWQLNASATRNGKGMLAIDSPSSTSSSQTSTNLQSPQHLLIGDAVPMIYRLNTTVVESGKSELFRRMSKSFFSSGQRGSGSSSSDSPPIGERQDTVGSPPFLQRPSYTASEVIEHGPTAAAAASTPPPKATRPASMSVLALPERKYDTGSGQKSEQVDTISITRVNNAIGIDIETSADSKNKQNGVRIRGFTNSISATNSALKVGDRITFVNGAKILNVGEFQQMVEVLTKNNVVKLGVVRNEKSRPTVDVSARIRKFSAPQMMASSQSSQIPPPPSREDSFVTSTQPPLAGINSNTADLLGLSNAISSNNTRSGNNSSSSHLKNLATERALASVSKMTPIEFLSLTACTKEKFQAMNRDAKLEMLQQLGLLEHFEAT